MRIRVCALLPLLAAVAIPLQSDAPAAPLRSGRQILALIAAGCYEQWTPLTNPVRDAQEIRDILVERYWIDQVHELHEEQATKANIIRLLVRLQEEVQSDDSLLILYCGHGHLDRSSGLGFWVPVNGGTDPYEQQNWLPHTQLRGMLANIRARHLCLISDSCFAGDLLNATRSMPVATDGDYFRRAYARVSRQVLTSGATEIVPDTSDFAAQLKTALRDNTRPCLDTLMLYNEVRLGVTATVPLLGALAGTGHQEGGSFMLFLREGLQGAAAVAGLLAVGSERGGLVYVDGVPCGGTGSGPVEIPGLQIGEHRIRLVYDDGRQQEQRVALQEGATQNVFFFAPGEPSAALPAAARPDRLFAGTSLGMVFPVAASSDALGEGPYALATLAYDFGLRRSDIGVGLLAGAFPLSSDAYDYELLCLPVAVQLRYRRAMGPGFFLAADLGAGASLNRSTFSDPDVEAVTTFKLLVAPALRAGLPLGRRFELSAGAGILWVFFDGTPLTAISPGVRLEYALSTPTAAAAQHP